MRRFLTIVIALCIASVAFAQSVREEIDAHPHLAISTQSVYAGHYYFRPIAEAPKGYKPFYISHYGRHGSRHESNAKYGKSLVHICRVADSLNLLTAKGKELKVIANKIYDAHNGRIGELTRYGVEQHKGIARRMYERFKPVFGKGAIIDSRSSNYTRCIMSMAAFNESLKECQPMLETRMDAAMEHQEVVRPTMPYIKDPRYNNKPITSKDEWWLRLVEWSSKQNVSHSMNMLFTNADLLVKHLNMNKTELATEIYKRLAFMQNLGYNDRTFIDSIFTPDERYIVYLYENYRWYCRYVSTKVEGGDTRFAPMGTLINDIIDNADRAIEGKNSASANFRFGHDYYLLGLFATIKLNEYSGEYDISDIEKLGAQHPAFRVVTMGSNLQLVYYRSKKSPDVLVRILENENDVTLPIKSVEGPFYKWEDVRTYLQNRVKSFQK